MNSSNIKSVLIFLLINMDSIMMKTAQFLKRIRTFLISLGIIVFFSKNSAASHPVRLHSFTLLLMQRLHMHSKICASFNQMPCNDSKRAHIAAKEDFNIAFAFFPPQILRLVRGLIFIFNSLVIIRSYR